MAIDSRCWQNLGQTPATVSIGLEHTWLLYSLCPSPERQGVQAQTSWAQLPAPQCWGLCLTCWTSLELIFCFCEIKGQTRSFSQGIRGLENSDSPNTCWGSICDCSYGINWGWNFGTKAICLHYIVHSIRLFIIFQHFWILPKKETVPAKHSVALWDALMH